MEKGEFMTTTEAAKMLGVDRTSVPRLIRDGKLTGERFGRAWMVTLESVKAYLERVGELPKHSPKRKRAAK